MKPLMIVPLAVAVAIPVSVLARPASPEPNAVSPELLAELHALIPHLDALAGRQEELAGRIEELHLRPETLTAAVSLPDDEEIERAVERWMTSTSASEAHPGQAAASSGARANGLDELGMEALVQFFLNEEGTELQVESMFEELRKSGRIDEFVEWIEKMAQENPDDPQLQVARGVAYLQKLFDLGNAPERGMWALQADQAFDAALELDPTNWDARFTKAVALSNWPPMMGKTNEAITHFEILIEQQKSSPPNPQHAQTYLFLGNMLVQTGDKAKAIEVWQDGLSRYPDDAGLREQLELAGR